jgi:cation diffusion facilitator CzcD-associated flavoprotein CzcO
VSDASGGAAAEYRVAIVGAGLAGIGAAIRLRQAGIDDFVVLERAAEIGGTWRDNVYPGCQCDVPANLYSYSFAPKTNWSRTFAPQQEIWDYIRDCVRRFDLAAQLRLNCPVTLLEWDDQNTRWLLKTPHGVLRAGFVIAATGALSSPAFPDLEGAGSFGGKAFHSARWDPNYDFAGARVAVIGTGASAVQIVPQLARRAGELHVYQRTAPWILPHPDRSVGALRHGAYRAAPLLQRAARAGSYWSRELIVLGFRHPRLLAPLERFADRHRERQVADPQLRAALRPRYRIGCKRILFSNDYYPAVGRDNVTLIASGAKALTAGGVVGGDGIERPADVIVFATGFTVTGASGARRIRGRDGRTLADAWQGSPHAYNGTLFAGFPNFAMLLGPHTGLGHTSVLVMIEAQIDYVLELLRTAERERLASLEPRAGAQAEFVAHVRRRTRGTVWVNGGCASWYLDGTGNTVLWPDFSWRFVRRLRRVQLADYSATPVRGRGAGYSSPE